MKTCVSSYSFGRYVDELGIYGVIDKAAEMGFEGMEFVEGGWSNCSMEELKKIGEYVKTKGMEVVSFCVGADFICGSDGNTAKEVERIKAQVDKAAALGAKNMRHDVASQPRDRKIGISYDECLPVMAKAIYEVAEYAQSKGVGTMTENHGYFSQDANRVEKLINTVGHPNFGALVDLGNFMCADEDPWKSVAIMAPYAKHVHAKDFYKKSGMEIAPGEGWFQTRAGDYLKGAIIGHGEAHIYQSIQTLKRNGYDGYLSVEFEGMEDNLTGIRIGLENLKRFMA